MTGILFVMSFFDKTPPLGATEYSPDDLHVTLLPESVVPENMLPELIKKFDYLTKSVKPFELSEVEAKVFQGTSYKVPVAVLGKTDPLMQVHNSLLFYLNSAGGAPVKPYVGNNYSPHISFKTFMKGETHLVEGFSVIYHKGGLGVDVINLANYAFEGTQLL